MYSPEVKKQKKVSTAKIGYVYLKISDDFHVTVATRYGATDFELVEMKRYVDELFNTVKITVAVGNFCKLGEDFSIPAYKVKIQGDLSVAFELLYKKYYRAAPGKPMFPDPEFHVTLDTREKRERFEEQIRNNNILEVQKVVFETRVDDQVMQNPVLENPVLENPALRNTTATWVCLVCNMLNPMSIKQCSTPGCTQWRPKPPARDGDWMCCGVNNYASRPKCMKCNQPRDAHNYVIPPRTENVSHIENDHVSNTYVSTPSRIETYASIQREFVSAPPAPKNWWCRNCKFEIYGSKTTCSKCGSTNPIYL